MEKNQRRFDLSGLALLIVAILLATSLCSYDPSDVIVEPVFPLNRVYHPDILSIPLSEAQTTNWCGQSGAFAADLLLRCFGWGAYYVAATLVGLAVALMLRRPIVAPFVRLGGWTISLLALCTVANTLSPNWQGPMIGPGGYLGALSNALLLPHLGLLGTSFAAFVAFVVGVVLCTDRAVLPLAALTGAISVSQIVNRKPKRKVRIRPADAKDGPAIKIGGKELAASEDEGEWDEEWEEEDGEEDDAEAWDEAEDAEGEDEWDEEEWDEEEDEAAEDEPAEPVGGIRSGLRSLIDRAKPAIMVRNRAAEKEKENPPPDEEEVAAKVVDKKATGKPDERQAVMEQLDEASRVDETTDYALPSINLLQPSEEFDFDAQEKEVRRKAKILEKTFDNFGFNVKVVEIETGPVIAQYEIELEPGLRLSKITGLADDLAIALRAPSVRIVAPIPGKNTVGIEVPNEERQVVRLREVMEEVNGRVKKMRIPLFLGKDVSGNPLIADLSTLPHLLIAGRTGTGKSVCLNAIISSILMTRRPDEVRMLMIDPKMVELSGYKTLPHLMHPVVTDMRKAEAILAWAVDKMEERYSLLAQAGVRHISGYNQLGEEELLERLDVESDDERDKMPTHLPYIVIVADEMADLMMTAGKEVEQHIIRLAQKSRAVGIHLILATQKPTVDVITGLIKSNLPARIAFQVASRTDSRVVLDEMGADKLLGNGDMLFLWPGTSMLLRGQGTYLDDDEIRNVVESVSTGEQDFVNELVQLKVEDKDEESAPGALKNRDDLYESAVDIVVREGRGSVSLLQRCLGIGYGRAARLIDFMAEDGIVGPYNGSQAREVTISMADWELMQAGGAPVEAEPESANSAPEPPAPKPAAPVRKPAAKRTTEPEGNRQRRSNKIIPITDFSGDESQLTRSGLKTKSKTEPTSETRVRPEDEELVDEELEADAEYEEEEVDGYEDEEYETDEYEYEPSDEDTTEYEEDDGDEEYEYEYEDETEYEDAEYEEEDYDGPEYESAENEADDSDYEAERA